MEDMQSENEDLEEYGYYLSIINNFSIFNK